MRARRNHAAPLRLRRFRVGPRADHVERAAGEGAGAVPDRGPGDRVVPRTERVPRARRGAVRVRVRRVRDAVRERGVLRGRPRDGERAVLDDRAQLRVRVLEGERGGPALRRHVAVSPGRAVRLPVRGTPRAPRAVATVASPVRGRHQRAVLHDVLEHGRLRVVSAGVERHVRDDDVPPRRVGRPLSAERVQRVLRDAGRRVQPVVLRVLPGRDVRLGRVLFVQPDLRHVADHVVPVHIVPVPRGFRRGPVHRARSHAAVPSSSDWYGHNVTARACLSSRRRYVLLPHQVNPMVTAIKTYPYA